MGSIIPFVRNLQFLSTVAIEMLEVVVASVRRPSCLRGARLYYSKERADHLGLFERLACAAGDLWRMAENRETQAIPRQNGPLTFGVESPSANGDLTTPPGRTANFLLLPPKKLNRL